MKNKNNSAQKIIQAIKKSTKPIICMDSRADFDALCSSIILHNYTTKTLGKNLRVTFDGTLPDSIKDITKQYADFGFVEENVCPTKDINFADYDLQIFLDSGTIEHICKDRLFAPQANIVKVNIDHHLGNPFYGDLNYVKHYASCCSVIFNLFKDAKLKIDKSLTNIFYLGLLLDSGFFQYNTVTSYDFLVASELVKDGAKSFEIAWKLTFNEKLIDKKLEVLVYKNLTFLPQKNIAYPTITTKELNASGIDYDQTSYPASDMIKKLEGVDFVFVIREISVKKFNVSLRSHQRDFDVLKIAQRFGGGGHIMAAGATLTANNLQEAVQKVLDLA